MNEKFSDFEIWPWFARLKKSLFKKILKPEISNFLKFLKLQKFLPFLKFRQVLVALFIHLT